MVIFLYGTDSYRRSKRVHILQEAFQKKHDAKGVSSATIDGACFSIDEFRKLTKSAGLFSTKRFVLFTNPWALSADDQVLLLSELESIPSDTILCISAHVPAQKKNKLFQQLCKADTIEEYTELSPAQLRSFIQQECKKNDTSIDATALEQLVTSSGTDLWKLTNTLHTLTHYSKKITSEIVQTFTDEAADDNIFHLTDALGKKDVARATQLLEYQFLLGANEQYLITMIAKQLATIYKVKKTNGADLAIHSFVIEKARSQARYFTHQQLLTLYWKLLQIDQKLKTTTTNPRALLDAFIVEACTA